MVPATVHAALVLVFAFGVKLAFNAFGIELNDEAYNTVAGSIVFYILSLLGLALTNRARKKSLLTSDDEYKPPFT
jgi:hypothetical protein